MANSNVARRAVLTIVSLLIPLTLMAVYMLGGSAERLAPAGSAGARPITLTAGPVAAQEDASWSMAGANPERTSWTPEEVRGQLEPVWFVPIEPYISQRVQIVAANDTLFVSTAKGLYALDAKSGALKWIYPTELPLGHSPTIYNGVAYVGGLDRKIHAIDASTGAGLWTYTAAAGFQTNPLVVNGVVYAGNRDGSFYAIYAEGPQAGTLAWKFDTGGAILYSAAYKDGVLFFAAQDSYAYALNAQTGSLVWKSAKLPGAGFDSWWPVVYNDRVIFSGSNNYRVGSLYGPGSLENLEESYIYPNRETDPAGTLVDALSQSPGDWAAGTPTIATNKITSYFATHPWRQTVFVLDRATGQQMETAPLLWAGNDGSTTRYPPVVGGDGILYQQNNYMSSPAIAGGQVSGWKPGSPYITVVSSDWGAIDEPHAASAGGNVVYWNLCCDRTAGAFDVTIPNTMFYDRYLAGHRPPTGPADKSREWQYFGYNLEELIPGYNITYFAPGKKYDGVLTNYGGPNGVYGFHNDVNPPIPYNGMVYMHRSNSVIAFGVTDSEPVAWPLISSPSGTAVVNDPGPLTTPYLQSRLVEEVDKILQAGHLRPGYISHGLFDLRGVYQCGSDLTEYWHDPSETIYTLLTALPLLPPDRQALVKTYLQNEFAAYPATTVDHVGWSSGSAREAFDLPPEVTAFFASNSAPKGPSSVVWKLNPFRYYALWKYAEVFGGADAIYSAVSKDKVKPPADIILLTFPFAHNAYIAGLIGYLNLEQMAGQPASTDLQAELARLLQLRAGMFTKNSYFGAIYSTASGAYCRTSSVSSNFMYMVPELANYLKANAFGPVQEAVAEYTRVAPYWFVSFASEGYAEDPKALLYDTIGIFNAKAMILGAPPEELVKYLDVPGFARGDLYYIQRLAMILQAGTPNASEPPNTPEPPEPLRGDMPENSYGR